jgi:hypothetical protein
MKKILFVISFLFLCTSKIHAQPADFVGDHIVIKQNVSQKLKEIRLNVIFPPQYKLLDEAKSHVEIMTEHAVIKAVDVEKFPAVIKLKQKITEPYFMVKLLIYYCKDDETGMCLKKEVLYDITTSKRASLKTLNLDYQIQADKD